MNRINHPMAVIALCFGLGGQAWGAEWMLDLRPFANRAFVDEVAGDGKGWSDQGPENSLREMPTGRFEFGGVPFEIIDGAVNRQRAVLVFDSPNSPTSLREATIKLDAAGEGSDGATLFLLHTACWVNKKDIKVGEISVQYAEGAPEVFPIITGRDLNDWWKPGDLTNATVAHEENNGSAYVGVYVSRFPLAKGRGKPVAITLRALDNPMWIVLAATLMDGAPPLPRREPWAARSDENWRVINLDNLEVQSGSALDLSSLVEPGPAGKHGFTRINERGELVFADAPNKPIRLFCETNGMTSFPSYTPEEIERYADQIVRAGYNCYRPHFLDSMLMLGSQKDLEINPAKWDLWDQLVAALKKRGVYLFLDATTSWCSFYAVADHWSKEAEAYRFKSRVYYDDAVREHFRRAMHLLLEHVNPYTGLALKNDPQVAVMTLRNESGLNYLMHRASGFDPDMVKPFRAWLKQRYGAVENLRQAWSTRHGDADVCLLKDGRTFDTVELPSLQSRGPDGKDLQRFFVDIERATYLWMKGVVREIGVHVPITDYNNGYSVETILARDANDFVDMHAYHDHPTDYTLPGSSINASSSLEGCANYFLYMAGTRVWGRPFTCSEWGQPFWNPWRHESGLVVPSLAALQNWQMITQFAGQVDMMFRGASQGVDPIKPFHINKDPPLKAGEYMAALLFQRGDIRPSSHHVEVTIDPQTAFQLGVQDMLPPSLTRLALLTSFGVSVLNGPGQGALPKKPVMDLSLCSGQGAEVLTVTGAQVARASTGVEGQLAPLIAELRDKKVLGKANRTNIADGLYESDTEEILIRSKQKQIEIVTPRTMGVSLPATNSTVNLPPLTINNRGGPASVFLASLDEKQIAESRRLLLIISTDALNSRMKFASESRRCLLDIGSLPVLMRVARLEFSLRHSQAKSLKMWALAVNGARSEEIPLTVGDGIITAAIDTGALKDGPTPYFEIAFNKEALKSVK